MCSSDLTLDALRAKARDENATAFREQQEAAKQQLIRDMATRKAKSTADYIDKVYRELFCAPGKVMEKAVADLSAYGTSVVAFDENGRIENVRIETTPFIPTREEAEKILRTEAAVRFGFGGQSGAKF